VRDERLFGGFVRLDGVAMTRSLKNSMAGSSLSLSPGGAPQTLVPVGEIRPGLFKRTGAAMQAISDAALTRRRQSRTLLAKAYRLAWGCG